LDILTLVIDKRSK